MDRSEILAKVIEVMNDNIDFDGDDLDENTSFKVLDIDSFDMLALVSALEEEFDLTFDTDDLDKIATIGDAVDAIEGAQ